MATNIHFEARRRQMVLDRACQVRKQRALAQESAPGPAIEEVARPETIMCTDQGQFYQTRSIHVWTGTERNRRSYDRSREGPILGGSQRQLEREMNFRQNSLSYR